MRIPVGGRSSLRRKPIEAVFSAGNSLGPGFPAQGSRGWSFLPPKRQMAATFAP
jgi:hypothetical protein